MARASSVPDVAFDNPRLARVGVEVLSFDRLRRHAGELLRVPQRPAFHLLALVERGGGSHAVDFVEQPLRSRSVLWVRAGQVQQWRMSDRLQGPVVLIAEPALAPSIARGQIDVGLLDLDAWPTHAIANREVFADAVAATARLRREIDRFDGADIDAALVWHNLLVVLLGLARGLDRARPNASASHQAAIHRMFMRELEARFHTRMSVLDYAARIGYSESTLSRACVSVTGESAKALLDRRIALEAKRLLIHSADTVAQIGHRLGFSEATNFVKFFVRLEGTTPQRFRAQAAPVDRRIISGPTT